jgi:hypothetical protein
MKNEPFWLLLNQLYTAEYRIFLLEGIMVAGGGVFDGMVAGCVFTDPHHPLVELCRRLP